MFTFFCKSTLITLNSGPRILNNLTLEYPFPLLGHIIIILSTIDVNKQQGYTILLKILLLKLNFCTNLSILKGQTQPLLK